MTIYDEASAPRVGGLAPAQSLQEVGQGERQQVAYDRREQIRQRAVQRMLVLDSPPEERFDRLTRLAQKVFDVPISTITLLDNDRVWRKSCAGMSVRETPRSESFCSAAVALERMLVVEDARLDPRFDGLSQVRAEPGIRFYAGSPLADPDGTVVGTFCLFDFRPRSLNERDRELLNELADWAQQELNGSADTRRAREVQQELLPRSTPDLAGYDIGALCLPAHTVGGDFYDYVMVDDTLGFCVADVMGKGTGAAIITATVRAAMRSAARRAFADGRPPANYSPASVLRHTNRAIQSDLEATGSLVTIFAGYIHGPSGTLGYADGGHGLTVVVGAEGSVHWLESLDLPLGVDSGTVWADQRVVLRPGATMFCFSDGLLDLFGPGREALGDVARLVQEYPDPGA